MPIAMGCGYNGKSRTGRDTAKPERDQHALWRTLAPGHAEHIGANPSNLGACARESTTATWCEWAVASGDGPGPMPMGVSSTSGPDELVLLVSSDVSHIRPYYAAYDIGTGDGLWSSQESGA